jgi:hypothetical protein
LCAWVALACSTSAFAQFETRSSIPDNNEPQSLTVADFNGDGFLDLAVAAHVTGQNLSLPRSAISTTTATST